MFVCPLCNRSLPLLPAADDAGAADMNVWLLLGHAQLAHPAHYDSIVAQSPDTVPAVLSAMRLVASLLPAGTGTGTNTGTGGAVNHASAAIDATLLQQSQSASDGSNSHTPLGSRLQHSTPAQTTRPSSASSLTSSHSAPSSASDFSFPFSASLPSLVDGVAGSPLSRYRAINAALSALFDGKHPTPPLPPRPVSSSGPPVPSAASPPPTSSFSSSSSSSPASFNSSPSPISSSDDVIFSKRRRLEDAAVAEAIDTQLTRWDSAVRAIAQVDDVKLKHNTQPGQITHSRPPSSHPLVAAFASSSSPAAPPPPAQPHPPPPPPPHPHPPAQPQPSSTSAGWLDAATVSARAVLEIGSSFGSDSTHRSRSARSSGGSNSTGSGSGGSSSSTSISGNSSSSGCLPSVVYLPELRRPLPFVADPTYYPALMRAGVSAGDAAQYVAYYQHCMAQDTLDKWRDEQARHDRERDSRAKEAAKQAWQQQHSGRSTTINSEQLLERLGGVQALRELHFTQL